MIVLLCSAALAAPPDESPGGWFVARNNHFEVFSQAGPERAKFTLMRFEELRSFFEQNRVANLTRGNHENAPVRVVEFRSAKEYESVKLNPTADAYFSAVEDRSYIVMPIFAGNDFRVAAHEYAHFVLYSGGLKLPPWLSEGLAELMSTVRVSSRECELGGAIPAHTALLRNATWLTASELFAADSAKRDTRAGTARFYAESWALVDLLTSAPGYSDRFGELVELLNSGADSSRAMEKLYVKSAERILDDAQEWIRHGGSLKRKLSAVQQQTASVAVRAVPESQAQAVVADLLMTGRAFDRAQALYENLLSRSPNDPGLLASLGTLALRKGDRQKATEYWGHALDNGLQDFGLCYRYALLADQMNLPSAQIEKILQRAVALRPTDDRARFRLAQILTNRDDYAGAVSQLRAIAQVTPGRAFPYWTSLAYALTELGQRDEAEAAAKEAKRVASTAEEAARAEELTYIAKTDVSVRFERNSEGNLQLVTSRIPHGATGINPFIEATDHIRVVTGQLREVQCSEGRLTGFLVQSSLGTLTLSVPDSTHVLIRNGPSEFQCGPHSIALQVKVEYASTTKTGEGLLRGMEF